MVDLTETQGPEMAELQAVVAEHLALSAEWKKGERMDRGKVAPPLLPPPPPPASVGKSGLLGASHEINPPSLGSRLRTTEIHFQFIFDL